MRGDDETRAIGQHLPACVLVGGTPNLFNHLGEGGTTKRETDA